LGSPESTSNPVSTLQEKITGSDGTGTVPYRKETGLYVHITGWTKSQLYCQLETTIDEEVTLIIYIVFPDLLQQAGCTVLITSLTYTLIPVPYHLRCKDTGTVIETVQ
jgi:hypothetical protein